MSEGAAIQKEVGRSGPDAPLRLCAPGAEVLRFGRKGDAIQ